MDLERRFRESLDALGVTRPSRCLVALSGGGDSVALLELVCREREARGLDVRAARVTHGIRSMEADRRENDLCSSLCEERNVPFTVLDAAKEIREREYSLKCGPEQAARTARHRIIGRLADDSRAGIILLGHTADDQLETIMMRLLSGAGPEGLKGISSRRGRLVRPLLFASREELRVFLKREGIRWAEDDTNADPSYLRNRLRNELLPLIADIFPGWTSSLEVLAERSAEAADALDTAMNTLLPAEEGSRARSWDAGDWGRAPEYLKALALWRAIDLLDDSSVPDNRIPWRSVKAARNALASGVRWGRGNITAEKRNGHVSVSRGKASWSGRVIISRGEADGFDAVLGDRRIRIHAVSGCEEADVNHEGVTWPLEIAFDENLNGRVKIAGSITEKTSGLSFADADKEIFYISIERVSTEGNDA